MEDHKAANCSTESEYIALAATIQECLYLTQLLEGIDKHLYASPKVYEDNQGTVALARNRVSRQRCKRGHQVPLHKIHCERWENNLRVLSY